MDQQRQKFLLQSEIRLLEKEKQDLSFSLEQLESTHKEAYTQHTETIKELLKRKGELLEQLDQLKEGMSVLTSAYTQSKESLEAFKNERLIDVEREVKEKRQVVTNMLAEAQTRKNEVEQKEFQLLQLDEDLKRREKAHFIQATELTAQSDSLQIRQRDEEKRRQLAENEIAHLLFTKEKLDISISSLQEQERALIQAIKENREKEEKERIGYEEKLVALERHELANNNRTLILDQREQELEEEARRIKDRRETLDRAVAEMKRKGVIS